MYLLGYIPNDGEKLTIEDNGVDCNILVQTIEKLGIE